MKTIGMMSAAALFGVGAFTATSAAAWDGYRYRTTTIHEFDDDDRPPAYGYRSVRMGEVYHAPRYRTRRITREVIEYDDHDDFDD